MDGLKKLETRNFLTRKELRYQKDISKMQLLV